MRLNADKRQCLWLTLDSEGQLRLYAHPDLDFFIPISLNQIVNLTQLNRLPAVGEMMPIWLKIMSEENRNETDSNEPRARVRNSARAEGRTMRNCAPAHNACADAPACVGKDETTKEETKKESGTKKKEKKKAGKEKTEEEEEPQVGKSDSGQSSSAKNNVHTDGTAACEKGSPRARKGRKPRTAMRNTLFGTEAEPLPLRQQRLWNMCVAQADRYDRDHIEQFFGFWSEANEAGVMLCETRDFFDVARRMARFTPDRGREMKQAVAAQVRRELRRRTAAASRAHAPAAAQQQPAEEQLTTAQMVEKSRREAEEQRALAEEKVRNYEAYMRSRQQQAGAPPPDA